MCMNFIFNCISIESLAETPIGTCFETMTRKISGMFGVKGLIDSGNRMKKKKLVRLKEDYSVSTKSVSTPVEAFEANNTEKSMNHVALTMT